jgi:hypothetical protein
MTFLSSAGIYSIIDLVRYQDAVNINKCARATSVTDPACYGILFFGDRNFLKGLIFAIIDRIFYLETLPLKLIADLGYWLVTGSSFLNVGGVFINILSSLADILNIFLLYQNTTYIL